MCSRRWPRPCGMRSTSPGARRSSLSTGLCCASTASAWRPDEAGPTARHQTQMSRHCGSDHRRRSPHDDQTPPTCQGPTDCSDTFNAAPLGRRTAQRCRPARTRCGSWTSPSSRPAPAEPGGWPALRWSTAHAEAYRIEYNTVRPHEACPGTDRTTSTQDLPTRGSPTFPNPKSCGLLTRDRGNEPGGIGLRWE